MANRNIQYKIYREKKRRRKLPRAFSSKNAGPMRNPGFIAEDGKFVDIGFSSRNKVASSSPNLDTITKYLLSKFPSNSTEQIYARTRGLHADLSCGDSEIILARLIQSRLGQGSVQGEQRFVYQIMKRETNWEVRLYMSGQDCFFVSEMRTRTDMVYRLSYEYVGLHRALNDFRKDSILWEHTERKPLS